ncbi:hypothetical protein LSCM1_05890 [Leishmania martiniquensis]|uniref:C2 domain-containing protein n=1 Tax=Leishmania martiniquensis TaxID=1580590 RepID=A0A836HDB5_9TRYP|nr:hypothetical protein LSCM1_05890 [Leishmania martiniquensis]
MATLKVTVHEARDLPIMDRSTGLADPYVVVKLDDMEHTTDIAHLTRNPVWEHDVRFDTADLLVLQEDPLEIRVYDHDIISRDDIVGMVLLDCNSIIYRASPVISGWFPLLDSGAGLHGDIRLTIRIKFHAAENPLAPALPERYVRRLDPAVAERPWSLAATPPGSNGGHAHHASSSPRTNEAGVSLSTVASAPGLNAAAMTSGSCASPTGMNGGHVTSAEQNPRGTFEPGRAFSSSVNVKSKDVGNSLSTNAAGTCHRLHKHHSTSRKLAGARSSSTSPSHAPSRGGAAADTLTCFTPFACPNFTQASSNLSVTVENPATAAMPLALPVPELLPCVVEQDLDPLRAARVDHPTLAAEEEGIFVFSVWRLDPAVFRVESTHSMMEELIVKADPEHVRFTNLRSSRSINDARVIQLFKLSGKVRRQLARKVVELQCNAVLGYVEEFDMEPNGIIVRAYGTPCVVSHVKHVDQREMEAFLRGKSHYIQSNMMAAYRAAFPGSPLPTAQQQLHTSVPPSYGASPMLSSGGVGGNAGGASTPATPFGLAQSAEPITVTSKMPPLPPPINSSFTLAATHDHLLPPPMAPCSSRMGASAPQRQSDQAVAAASGISTPLSSTEAAASAAFQLLGPTPETYARVTMPGDGGDSAGATMPSLEESGVTGASAAAPVSAFAGTQNSGATLRHHSQLALTLANNPLYSTTLMASEALALSQQQQQQPSHSNRMMRSSPTDTTAAAIAANSAPMPTAAAPPTATALVAASGAAVGVGPPARVIISMLTVKDLPAGSIQHIGGYICARSVKIVSRVKSRQIISQERDAWWMELREELRANARAFHCNTVLGYEEETQYHEDVVLLSLYGTAVMLDMAAASLRAGPEYLFRWQRQRVAAKRHCALLHLYEGPRRKGDPGILAGQVGDLLMHHVCSICHSKPVPDVLLAGCTLPVELKCEAPPRLVQVAVSKPKVNAKGVELAMAVSQALPFIEFALHKQLLFNLRLQQLNACFSLRVSIAVGQDAIVGMLTGTGCRLAGLPVPRLPRVSVLDQQIARKESVMRLRDVIASRRRRRSNTHATSSSSSSSSSSSRSTSSSSASAQSCPIPGADGAAPSSAVAVTGLRALGCRDDVRCVASALTKAASAAVTTRSSSASRSSHRGSSSSSASKRRKRRRRRRRRHRTRGKRGRGKGDSSSLSHRTSESASVTEALLLPTSGIQSLQSSDCYNAVVVPTQGRSRSRRTRHAGMCASALTTAAGAAAANGFGVGVATSGTHSRGAASSKSRSPISPALTPSSLSSGPGTASRSSSSRRGSSFHSSPSGASSHSWVPTESTETDEDVYAAADEWRTTSGGVRTKARDYVVKIDDVEEADMMLGMVDATEFEDGVLLTLPYVPDSANVFDWQERIVLDRRYSRASTLPIVGGGGTGAAALTGTANTGRSPASYGAAGNSSAVRDGLVGTNSAYPNRSHFASAAASGGDSMNAGGGTAAAGRMALTTRLLNEYCADAKRAFVHRACRMAMRTGQPRRLRVVSVRVEMMFVPNSADLQLRLEGCVMVASRAGARLLHQLEDRAFRVCMHYAMESLSGLCQHQQQPYPSQACQNNPGGGSTSGQRAAGVTPIMSANTAASVKATPYPRWRPYTPVLSPLMADAASGSRVTSASGGPAAAAAAAETPLLPPSSSLPSMPQLLAAGASAHATHSHNVPVAASMSGQPSMSFLQAVMDSEAAYLDARRLFITSNAPFSLPYVQDITLSPPRVWSGVATAVSEDAAAPARHTSTYAEYRDSRGSRATSLTRRWNAFIRATGQSIKSLVDRATGGVKGDRRMQQQQQQRQWVAEENASLTFVGGAAGVPSSVTGAARDANYCNPAARLPKDISQLQAFIPVVLFTPLDYIAGRSIVRYLGRLSQHFIREDYDTDTGDGLNMFFQRAETEIVCVVQALVRLMGGNALLKHRIVYHEICDSDGSGKAFLFATVTGDVVQVSDTLYWGRHAQRCKGGGPRKSGKDVVEGDFSDDGDSDGSGSRKE